MTAERSAAAYALEAAAMPFLRATYTPGQSKDWDMLCFHQSFMKSVVKKRGMQGQEQKDISTFYCTLIIYRNIIRYKAGMCLMLIGSEFVLASIVFSFFYRNISELFLMFVRL